MTVQSEIFRTIHNEITEYDPAVRAKYLTLFRDEVLEFCRLIEIAWNDWAEFDSRLNGNKNLAYISGLLFGILDLCVSSMKLLIEGHQVAAGNLYRQAHEMIALAILCSDRNLGILERFVAGRFSTNKSIDVALRKAEALQLDRTAIKSLQKGRDFYHSFSHPTPMTMATKVSFSGEGMYLGAAFDQAKVPYYKKEVAGRLSLAKVLPNIISGVCGKAEGWRSDP